MLMMSTLEGMNTEMAPSWERGGAISVSNTVMMARKHKAVLSCDLVSWISFFIIGREAGRVRRLNNPRCSSRS